MKKYFITLLLTIAFQGAFSQTMTDFVNEFKGAEKAEYNEIPKALLALAGAASEESDGGFIAHTDNMMMLSIPTPSDDLKKNMLKSLTKLEGNGYSKLLESSDEGENIVMYCMKKGEVITEILMVSFDEKECEVLALTGKFDTKDVEELTSDEEDEE